MRGEGGMDSTCGDFSVLDGVDDFAAVTETIAPGKEAGDARFSRGTVDDDRSFFVVQAWNCGDQVVQVFLSQRLHHHVGGENELGSRHRADPARPGCRIVELGLLELNTGDARGRTENPNGRGALDTPNWSAEPRPARMGSAP